MQKYIQQAIFVLRFRYLRRCIGYFRKQSLLLCGMKIGKGTNIPIIHVTWPHQVSIGENCNLEHEIYFKYDGIWSNGPSIIINDNTFIGSCCEFNIKENIEIGNDCLIASGVRFVDHDHGINLSKLVRNQLCPSASIRIENNVWIGANVIILKGVTISTGAVIAAGAVVNKSISSNEIWGGVPAKKIGERK